ncbi:MAG: OB-fold nucleic acid binding domain-containing protein [Nocardioidaceae bacterium]
MSSASTRTPSAGGFLKKALNKLSTSTGALEAEELQESAEAAGCRLVTGFGDRDVVTAHGSLRAVTLRPRGGVSALEAELDDGSGTVTLIWLGRRRITGIDPGRQLTVHGRISCTDGNRVLYNPRYELSA